MSSVPALLSDRLWFPDPCQAETSGQFEGLVAIGGDLSVPRLLLAYGRGIFPWTAQPITWWSPNPRGIFEFDRVQVSRSLRRTLRRNTFIVTFNRAFREVMEGCAEATARRPSTWITPEFLHAYTALHQAGHAHSVECWHDARLVGGVYGVAVGGLFAAESMFHRTSDASKVALFHLIERLRKCGFTLVDVQMVTPITLQLGASTIPRREYLNRLGNAVRKDAKF